MGNKQSRKPDNQR